MKTRRILATVLAIVMLASFISVPVFADEAVPTLISSPVGEGYVCEDLGILVGPDEDGVTEEYLDTLAMRTQAAMVNLRLFGLEAAALDFDGEETFEDAADATAYWQPILEYLKANPGMGWVGDEEGNFLPNEYITGQAFTKILLIALGYEYGLDFDWEITMDFAAEVGLTYLADKADTDLTVRDIAIAIIEALGFKTNSSTDVTLLSQLVLDGIIDEADAIAAGFEVEEPTLAIVNAYPSSTDEVTVVLNMDVPEGTPITLKKATAGYVVTEVIDGSTVTLTTLFTLPAGNYTVMVGTESAEFEVMAPYAVELVFAAESVHLADDQDLGVTMYNQYGEAMTLSGTNYSVFNQTNGYVYYVDVDEALEIDVQDDGDAEAGDTIYIFVYDPISMLTVSGELPIIDAPVLSEIVIGDVTNGDEDAAMLFQDTKDHILDLEGIDQYGNPYEISLNDLMDGTIQYLLSNEECISFAGIVDGDIQFDTVKPGDFIFTFILPTTAFITTTEVLTVYPDPALTSIEIAGPVEAVYAKEEVTFPVVGLDQYGNLIDVDRDDDIMFTYTVDLDTEIGLEKGNDNSIYFYAYDAGTTTVYYFLDGVFQGTFDVTVNEEAYPFQVVGLNDVPTAYLTDTYKIFSSTSIDVIDQYGRPIDMYKMAEAGFELYLNESEDNDNLRNHHIDLNTFVLYAEPGDEFGSDTFYLGIYNPDLDDIAPESIYTFSASHVDVSEIHSYTLDVIADTLCSNDENWDYYEQFPYSWSRINAQFAIQYDQYEPILGEGWFSEGYTPYASPLIFKAFLEDGTEVNLFTDEIEGFILEELTDTITFSLENVELGMPMFFDYQTAPTVIAFNEVEGTCIIKAWINGEPVAETTVEVSKAAPVVAGITAAVETMDYSEGFFEEDNVLFENFLTQIFYVEEFHDGPFFEFLEEDSVLDSFDGFIILSQFIIVDQYGVELPWEILYLEEEIIIIENFIETADGVDLIVTMMTTDGVYYDSIRVINFEMDDS